MFDWYFFFLCKFYINKKFFYWFNMIRIFKWFVLSVICILFCFWMWCMYIMLLYTLLFKNRKKKSICDVQKRKWKEIRYFWLFFRYVLRICKIHNTIKRIKRNRIKITIFINTISKYLIGGIILHHEIDIYISSTVVEELIIYNSDIYVYHVFIWRYLFMRCTFVPWCMDIGCVFTYTICRIRTNFIDLPINVE